MPTSKNIFSAIILIITFSIVLYTWGIISLLQSILSICIYLFIYIALQFLWLKIRKKQLPTLQDRMNWFFYKVSIVIIFITIFLWSFSYYQNEISPAPMPEYTLSNGEKEVVFQAMSHIGSNEFYIQVQSNLRAYKNAWWVYFFEWVRPGTPENMEAFNEALGIEFDPELYKNFSQLYGVSHQDNSIFFDLVNDLDFNVDLSIDDIMEIYNSSKTSIPKHFSSAQTVDINSEIEFILRTIPPRQLAILQYLNKAILNLMIKSDGIQEAITNNYGNPKIFEVILSGRDQVLAQAILESEYPKIYTTYGLLHFEGVLELLQQEDENWKIIWEEYLYPIQ